jgi:hypothetical protein
LIPNSVIDALIDDADAGCLYGGAPKGNRNAWKHGHYSAEAIALRRLIRRLLSDAADLVEGC